MKITVSAEDVNTYYPSKGAEVRKKFGGEPEIWSLEWLDNLPRDQMKVRLVGTGGKREKCSSNFPGIPHHVELLIATGQI